MMRPPHHRDHHQNEQQRDMQNPKILQNHKRHIRHKQSAQQKQENEIAHITAFIEWYQQADGQGRNK